ncbi:hypothetical protein JTE90_016119 [Oedothorax gibbosus]|uniref:NOC3-like protein n=1 Tax=Oedothorax gibbosus TaxID=931172 RepID=A0AAV6U1T8_9ARAC|nr:hypothetical protein JTE90_016119 [Oedothorax gibbosus]
MKHMKNKRFNKAKGPQKNPQVPNFNKKRKKKIDYRKSQPEEKPISAPEESDNNNASESSDVEEDYEKAPRLSKTVKVRNLLPIKSKKGLKYRSEVVAEETEEQDDEQEQDSAQEKDRETLVQSYAVEQKCLKELKRKVALLCTSLVEDPDSNMVALKELVTMLQNPTTKMIVSERKILCLSLFHVFQDILPSYRIRAQEEKDTKVKLKKDTLKLLGFEQTLLKCYTKYVDLLYGFVREMKKAMSKPSMPRVRQRAAYEVGLVAVKCMCELLSTRFNFNYFKNIANKLVPLSMDVDEKVSNMCCQAFEIMFKADKLGESSFNLVKQIVDVVKERKFNIPVVLLRTFLSLNLREAKVDIDKVDMNKGRKEWQKMSRTERKDKKKLKDLEAELKEAQAYECVETVKKFHTNTLNKIFWIFFHILKDGQKTHLIAPALEGLAKFAYLINLEFFDDLNSVLCGMMENGTLSEVEKLHGVYTLFTILAGQAESLHIDPHRIYCHMYQGLLNLGHSVDVEHFDLTLKCLEYNVLRKRKKISSSRLLAFAKRVSTVCLQTPVHGTLGLMCSLRNIFTHVKGADILLDSESSVGSGLYLPEMEDPEHCNPQSTALWELHLLKKHYNPAIKLFAQHLLHSCPHQGKFALPDQLGKSSPEETLHLFAEIAVNNKMDFLEDAEEPPKKKIKFDYRSANLCYENEVELDLGEEAVMDVDFC